MMATLLLPLMLVTVCRAQFMVGRLREGQYELPGLNGWMTPG